MSKGQLEAMQMRNPPFFKTAASHIPQHVIEILHLGEKPWIGQNARQAFLLIVPCPDEADGEMADAGQVGLPDRL